MPESRHFPWIMDDNEPVVFTEMETVDCPRCHFRIPVKPEYTDYKDAYESYKGMYSDMQRFYEGVLEELGNKYPDVKIDLELQKEESIKRIKNIFRRYLGNEYGEE